MFSKEEILQVIKGEEFKGKFEEFCPMIDQLCREKDKSECIEELHLVLKELQQEGVIFYRFYEVRETDWKYPCMPVFAEIELR